MLLHTHRRVIICSDTRDCWVIPCSELSPISSGVEISQMNKTDVNCPNSIITFSVFDIELLARDGNENGRNDALPAVSPHYQSRPNV